MRINKTVLGVIIFLCILLASAAAEKAFSQPYIDLGTTYANSSLTTGGIGMRFNGKWDVQLRSMGEGETKNGEQEQKFNVAFSRVFSPGWEFIGGEIKSRIGIAYTPDLKLVGPYNYRLGLIWSTPICEIEIMHDSSAGTYKPNTGIDAIVFRLML